MFNKQDGNFRLKVVAILAACFLWLYVMAIIDPEERKVMNDIPISITNLSEVEDNGLMIYPEKNITTDLIIRGKLSDIQKINNDNVHVYGIIDKPIEGKNQITLKTNLSGRVSHDFKNEYIVVNLEKVISKEFKVNIITRDDEKDKISKVTANIDEVVATGPRSEIDKIEKVGAEVELEGKDKDFSKTVKLRAYDKAGKPLEEIKFDHPAVDVEVTMPVEKKVPVKIDFTDATPDYSKFSIIPSELTLVGNENVVKEIKEIYTEKISQSALSTDTETSVNLIIPDGVKIKEKAVSVQIKKNK